ncbi:uncharacterized protein M6B38_182140 [Iris pallida]|uniref:Uncharacterized protein n=1 Tax=Iris pallida TaxID=29817 RepID=A0AAX6EM51_IRIPA|nr:uncharacterized protein M6B38_182140 [Iris pallida]
MFISPCFLFHRSSSFFPFPLLLLNSVYASPPSRVHLLSLYPSALFLFCTTSPIHSNIIARTILFTTHSYSDRLPLVRSSLCRHRRRCLHPCPKPCQARRAHRVRTFSTLKRSQRRVVDHHRHKWEEIEVAVGTLVAPGCRFEVHNLHHHRRHHPRQQERQYHQALLLVAIEDEAFMAFNWKMDKHSILNERKRFFLTVPISF